MKKSSVLLDTLRRHFKRPVAIFLALFFPLCSAQVRGATLYYQGFDGPWDTTTAQWSTASSLPDTVNWVNGDVAAFFAQPGTVTLSEPITAGGLIFGSDGNVITGNTLTLSAIAGQSSPRVNVATFKRATINSIIAGTSGLTKTGNGTLLLGNNSNTFSGDVVINGGAVVITNQAQLGTGTTTISVNGLANTGNPGFSGGSLILQGGLAGMTLSRDISFSGRGPGAANNGGALVSVGNNTIAGNVVIGGTGSQGNIVSAYGITTITGDLQLGVGSTQTLFGNGNFIISGQVTGYEVANDRFDKSGNVYGTTLWLQNANNNFAESLRIDSGTVRVSTNAALGNNTSTQAVDLNNGILEVRTDTPGVGNADFSKRKVFNRDNTNTGIFVSRDVNGSAINQTVILGETRATGTNTNFRITGRDGYNVTLLGLNNSTTGVMGQGGTNNALIENNSNGLLTLATSSLWNQTDTTARTLTIQGNGDTLLAGNLTATGAAHTVAKSGTGTLTIQGTSSTFIGSFNVNSGTVAINSFGAINSGVSGALQLSSGALNYLGAAGTGAGETVSKSINLTSTTGSGIILANQTGSSPTALIISNSIAATGAGSKSLYLGGASTLQNEIQGVIQDNTSTNKTSLVKIGSGTWLYDPSASTYVTTAPTGVTTTGGGAVQTNSFTVSSAAGLVVGQTVSGTNIPAGSIITAINGNTITINTAIGTTAVATATALTFGTVGNFTGSVTVAGGTLQIKATAGSGNGSDVISNGSALIFNADPLNTNQVAGGTFEYLGYSGGALTESLGALTMTAGAGTIKITAGGGATGLTFSSLATPAIGTGLNVIGNGTVTLTGVATSTATTLAGNGHIYFGGSDFARSNGGVLVAPVYGTDAGFVTAGAALTAGNHNLVTGNTSSGALTISSLKISGSQTVAQTGLLTINVGTNTSGGILQTGGSGTISGTGVTTNGTQDLVVRVDGVTDSLLISAPITSTTAGGLTKNGLGVLVLSGANAEAGTVTVNEGTLQMSGAGLLGATNINLTVRQGATFDLNGVNIGTVASGTNSVNALNGAGIITNSAASGTAVLRFSNNNTGGVFTGLIQDGANATVSLVKAGASSTVTLTGANTFTGPVTINGGTLDIPNIANIGVASGIGMGDATSDATNAASIILNGGALRYVGTNSGGAVTATQTPSVSINRLFTLAGNGTIASYGSYGNLTASRAANNATLIFNNTADLVFSGTGARTLTLDGDSQGDNEIDIHLIDNPNGGALSLAKTNAGLWILNPSTANTYSGTTSITGGALQAVDGFGLSANSNLLLNGGVYQTSGTFNRAMGTGAGQFQFTANGNGGFSSSTSKLTVDFSSLGTPVWGSTAGFAGAGTLILNNATSLADVEVKGNFNLAVGTAAALTISTTSASANITITTGNTNGLTVGQAIAGTNIPAGSYINSITGLTTFTISQNASATATGVSASVAAGGFRQIQVDDNTSTNLDFATVSGVIGGTGGLGKIGTGNLILGDANTYSGRTVIRQEAVFATSIGAAGATASSFGTNVSGGILELGNPGTTTTVSLMYVGAGETTTREIDLTGTTGTRRIDSSGSGALVLTNLLNTTATSVNTTGGAKTLELRGTNTDANMITSVLTDNAGALTITKADGGVWILNPTSTNSYTGVLNANGGLLGLTSDGIGTAASITISNGGVFAYGGDLTTSTNVILANNATAVFAGSNNITLNGTVTKASGANDQTFSNNLENGAVLTINGNFINAQNATATRVINVRGYGSTVWNGLIQNFSATSVTRFDIRLSSDASFTLGGDNLDAALGLTGGILLGQGTLIVANEGGLGPAANNVILDGGVLTSTVDLTGANKILNNVFLQGDPVIVNGSNNIEFGAQLNLNASRSFLNNLDAGKLLTISGTVTNSAAATLTIFGSGNTLINGVVGTGTGAQGLQYSGTGTLSLTGTNTMTGTLTVSRSTVTISGANGSVNAAAGVTLNAGGTLTLDNSCGNNASGRVAGRAFTFNGGALNLIGNGTTETMGNALVGNIMGTVSMSGTGSNTLSFATVNFNNSGSSWDLTGISGLGTTNKVKFTTYQHGGTTFTNAILPRILILDDFAAYDNTNGVVAFTAYNTSTNLDGAASTDTMNVTGSANVSASRTLNAMKINGSGVSITSTGNRVLTLTTGSVISTGGDNTLAVSQVNLNAQSGYFQVQNGTTLHVTSTLINGQLSKVGGGTLSLESTSFYNSTTNVMGGTLQLNAGLNAIFPAVNGLNIGIGATVDLNGSSQYIGNLTGSGGLPNTAGTLTNSASGPLNISTFVTNGGGTFGGVISGNLNLGRVGGGTLALETAQTYTGATSLLGGTTTLENDASLLTTSAIDINGATLVVTSNTSLQTQNNDRIGDGILITLRGGTIQINGRVDTAATETLGAMALAQGANTIQAATGGTGTAGAFTSMDLTIASLSRSAGTTANFQNSTALGSIGNVPRIVFTTAPITFGDGVLGAWAISNSSDYAAYNSANGVGTVGNGGYAGYSAEFGSGKITGLGTLATAPLTTTLSGTTTASMLRIGGNFTDNIAFTTSNAVLNLELGGLLRSNNVFDTTIGSIATRGILTAGGTETNGTRDLIVYLNATGNPTFTGGATTTGTNVITMSSTIGLQPGMTLTNAGLPAGTTIVSIDSLTQVTVSNNATATATSQTFTGGAYLSGTTTQGSAQITMNSTVGIAPGMTLTGTGIPAGSYVVSVDSPTQVTLSQVATANGSALNFTAGVSNMIINSVIADNGFGNSVSFVKSGAGVLNLSANNTYTGGTVVDQGTLNLIGTGVVLPAGGLTINNAAVTMLTNNGQIAAANDVFLVGSSTLTLAGGLGLNNTLRSITFNNNGGSGTPTLSIPTNSILTLTSSAPVTVLNSNAATVPTISGGFLALGIGANTFSIQGPTLNGQLYTQIGAALSISSVITGAGTSINKTDTGLLQLSGQNTFDGGMSVQGGGIILSAGSTSTVPNSLLSGPLGTGSVSFANGTSLLTDNNSRTVANAMSFAGNPIFNNTGTTLVTLTLNGALNFATQTTTGVVVNIPTPYLNVVLGGPIANIGTITSIGGTGANTISKTGPGNITGLDFTGIGSSVPINIGALSNGAFSILHDGDATGSLQTINLGAITWEPAVTGTALVLTIGRAGTALYYPLAVNKTIAPSALISSQLGNGINLTNNNNYGLLLADNITFNTVSANQGPTFTVATASTSLQPDGLTLSGVLSGGPTGASAVVLTKAGAGVLTLTNAGNTFGGGGSIIDITAGQLAASNDGALGNSGNIIRLSGNNLGYGFRATGTFASSHTFNLNSAAGEIEVTQGNTLTLNNAFTFATANNAFRKYDIGTLVLTQPETGWNGVMFIQQGVLRISDGAQLGNASSLTTATATTGASGQTVLTPTGGTASYGVGQTVFGTGIPADTTITAITATTITLSANTTAANPTITTSAGGIVLANVGAALELTGGVTVADGVLVNASNNATSAGINEGGAIRSTAGINTVSGVITIATTTADNQMRAATLAADAGATLNITGGVVGQVGTAGSNRHSWVGLGGAGTINITTTGFTNTGTLGIYQLNKFGTGTLNIQVANAFSGRDVIVKQGTLSMNGAGTFGALGSGQGALRTVYVHDFATLALDNSGVIGNNVNNRLGNAALNFQGSDFRLIGNDNTTTTETTTGTMTINAGALVFTLDAGAGQQLNFTTAAVTRNAGSTLLIRADGFGNAAGANVATIQGSTATYTFTGELGGTGSTNKSILPWAFGNNTSLSGDALGFVTADSSAAGANAGTNRLRLLSASEQVTGITAPVTLNAFENLNVTTAISGTSTFNILNPWQVNSLQLSSGGSLSVDNHLRAFTIESGGLLALAGSSGISGNGYLTTTSNRELIIYNIADLNIGIAIAGTTSGLTKSGSGVLTLTAGNSFTGTVTVNDGTLKLGGGDQTILPNQALQLNAGNLDLNGTVQNFNSLFAQTGSVAVNDGFAVNTGGNVINTSASQATIGLTTANVSFRGAIGNGNVGQSNIAVVRSQSAGATQDWNLYSDNTYTGATLLNGGRTQLIDGGKLSGTSSIEISNSTLSISASNISTEPVSLTDRINDAASITLNGAMFQWRSRAALYSTEQLGVVKLGYGSSIIDFSEPGTSVNQSDITFASFAQVAGQHGTVRFLNIDGNISALQRLFISNLNGVATTNIGDGLTNNIIGGWATFEREFATYTPGEGVAGLTNNGYAGYSPNTIFNGTATDNIRILLPVAGSTTTLTADTTLYTLNLQANTGATGSSVLDLGGKTLTLASGGLILSPISTAASANSINLINGSLTAGTTSSAADLYLHALSWLNNQADNTGNADVTVSANIINNVAGGAVTLVIDANNGRGTLAATNDVFITGSNTYTGGTFVNSGRVVLNTAGANGTTLTAIGSGDLTIAGGYSSNPGIFSDRNTRVVLGAGSQIKNTATVTIMGGATLDLNGFNQTVGGIVFNNNGGDTPTITTGTNGNLFLGGNVHASGQNLGSVSTISTAGTGTINLGGSTRTFTVDPVQWNGENLNYLLPNLNVTGVVVSTAGEGIIKNGTGLLQLSGQNTFSGGVNLVAGGLAIGASTNVTARDAVTGVASAFTSGSLGTGVLTIGAGTFLTSSSSANIINNDYAIGGNFSLKGNLSLTLNGATTLASGSTTITVDTILTNLTLNGIISGTDNTSSIIKAGQGTLTLGNNNTFQGGITLNGGNLVMAGLNGGFASPIPGGAALINSSNALLSLLNNGGGSGTVITYANDITLAGAISGAGLNIGNNGANTSNIVEVANLNIASGQTLDVSSANGFQLRLLNVNTTGATAAKLNPSLGTIIYVFNYGSLKPVNVGLGTVIFPELPVINTTTPLANGSTITGLNPVVPQAATLSSLPGDYNGGGLSASFYQFATSAAISSAIASGAGASGTFGQVGLGDMGGLNHPIGVTSTNFNGGISVQSGYLQIVSGGNYTFRTAADDSSILYIDGRAIISNATGGAAESAGGTTVFLSAGYHSIVFKQENASGTTNSGGFHVLYSGPDTVSDQGANTTPGNFQAIPTSRLFAASTNLATAGNNYLTAAQLTGGWNLAGSDRASVDTLGSVLNSSIDTLSIGNGTTAAPTILSIVSGTGGSIGAGWFGVTGTTTVGSNAILNVGLNPTSAAGMLYLIGGVSDSGNGFVKTGSGSLIMGSSASFTGALTVQAGTLVVAGSNALTTGTTTIAGGNATVTSGITTGLTTVTMASTAGRSVGELVIGTGIPQGAFITRIVNGTTVEISDAATATNAALAAVFATGATLDLNGITGITGNIVLNGTGQVNPTTGTATSLITAGGATITAGMLGGANAALWNSSANAASVAGNITINTNNVQIGGQGDISLDGTVTSSASNPLTKISGNTLTLTADNSTTLLGAIAVNSGTLRVGNSNALGATSSGTTVASGAVLDLNGFSISEPLTISGTGLVNLGLSVNSLGALINSSTTTSVLSGSLTLAANASIGSSGFNGLSGVTEGSIQIDGLISGNFTLTKVGTASLIITNSGNTYDGTTINQGAIIVRGSGRLGDAGTITINGSGFSSGVLASQLILDNTTIASSTRLGGLPLSLTGGLLEIDGNSATAVNETLASNQSISINNMYNMITLVNNGANVRITTAGTGTLTRVSNGAILIRGTNLGSAAPGATNTNLILATAPTFTGQTATSGKNMRVLSWVIADPSATGNGTGANATFATWDATNGIRPLNLTTEMDTTFTANNNIRLTSALNSGADATVFSNTTVNSLTFESGGSLTINALRNVTVDSGGILAKASGIISGTGSITATTANNLSIFTMGSGTLLEIDVSVGGLYGAPSTAGLSKSGEGTLMLNAQNNYIGETRLNLGTLQLGSFAPLSNAIFYRFTEAPAPNATAVTLRADNFVSQEGSIFDLNGHNQTVGSLASTLTQPGGGGIITNQAAGFVNFQTLMTGSFTFAGSINDNLNFIRSGGSTLTLTDNSNYSGTTLLMGGLTTLQDQGRISGGGTITINRSVLRWDDSGIQALSDRLSSSTSASNANSSSIILNGGALYYISRAGTNGVATFGDLTLASNASFVQAGIGNGNVGTAAMSFGSLIRQGTASVTFSTANGGLGDNPFITFSTAPTLTNGIIGAWATVITTTPSSGAFALANPNQTYTGGTIIDSATTSITATTAGIVIPTGGLTLNNAALNFTGGSTTLFGLIDASNVITLNGGASLTFPNYTVTGSNTFNSIVFNNMGGTATPTFNLGTPAAGSINKVILTAANAITVVNDNLGTTPTISGTYTSATQFASLEFSNASPVISVSGLSPMGLIISAAITQNVGMTSAISKTGSGSLVLNNANSNWTTGFNLNGGTLILDAASAGTPPTITNGPLGTGTLTIADGTTIQAGTAARVIGNVVTINGNFTFGGQASTQNLTFSGTVNLGTASRTITVSSPQVTATISGKLTSGAGSGLTKAGDGTLVLSGTGNDYNGATIVSGGLLKYGSTNAIPVLSAVSVLVGGTLDLNGGGAAITFASLSGSSSTTGGLITTSATSGTVTLTIGDSTSTAFGGAITNNVGSTLNLVKVGTGTLTLGGPNSYSGSTTINAGGITTAASNVLPDTSAVTLAATTASATVTLDLNGNNDGIASLTYAGAADSIGVVQTGVGTLTLFGNVTYDATSNPGAASLSGNVNLGGATRTFTIGDSTGTTQELTVSAIISGTTATDGVTKAGAGTMVLSGANTYTGKTAVNAGTLSISADNNLGAVPGGAVADQLTLNGGTLQTSADMTIADSRGITVGASGGTFETVTGTTATVNSVVTGGGVINKTGGGTLLFTAANTNTAATNVNAGTLGGTGTVGGDLNVNTGGTVAPGIAAAGLLTIGGNLTVNSGGTLLMQVGGATLNDADSIRGNQGSLTSLDPSVIAGWENANTLSLHDRIFSNDVSAPVINGTFKIDPAFLNGYTATYGDVFDFLDWSNLSNSITGTTTFDFSGVVLGSGLAFNTDLFASNGIIVIVPEPGRAFLLLFGLLGLFLHRRRRAGI